MTILQILWNDIFPLFAFIGCGWFLDSKFKIDISTYSKLTVYVVLPCFVFFSIYQYEPHPQDWSLVPAALLLMVLLFVLSGWVAKWLGLSMQDKADFQAISTFSNSGHLGAALVMLVFSHDPFVVNGETPYLTTAMGTMAILMILMNVAVNTWGGALIRSDSDKRIHLFPALLKMPVFYAVLLAVLVRFSPFRLEGTFLYPVFTHFDGAFIILVMITIGLQLHRTHLTQVNSFNVAAAVLKLLVSPLLAWLFITIMGQWSPEASQVFFLYAAVPSSLTLVLYGIEFRSDPQILTQSVIFNTLIGIVTMTAAIYLARILFPVGL